MKYLLLVFSLALPACIYAQELLGEDCEYVEYIKTIQLTPDGFQLSPPMIGKNGRLLLSFDDLEGGSKHYRYSIEYCNRDWSPSELKFNEYANGLEENPIRTSGFSQQTYKDYTNYQLFIPNSDIQLQKTGNYLIHVFDADQGYIPVLTRRFMLASLDVTPQFTIKTSLDASQYRTHQRLELKIPLPSFSLSDPINDITCIVMQNGWWEQAVTIKPTYVSNEYLEFNEFEKLTFPAVRQFRQIDLRNINSRSRNIQALELYGRDVVAFVEDDKPRDNREFEGVDFNGRYNIDRRNNLTSGELEIVKDSISTYNPLTNEYSKEEVVIHAANPNASREHVQSDYVFTNFILKTKPYEPGTEMYLMGQVSDWTCNPYFQLKYNTDEGGYTGEFPLKQGIYNYLYGLSTDEGKTYDFNLTEGNLFETENEYTVLVYYRPFGARNDELIGFRTMAPLRR